jgi:hypothetical protein
MMGRVIRRSTLVHAIAVALALLAASPVTAPFITLELGAPTPLSAPPDAGKLKGATPDTAPAVSPWALIPTDEAAGSAFCQGPRLSDHALDTRHIVLRL